MKVLLFVPKRYGFHHSFKETFALLGAEVVAIDYYDVVSHWEKRLNAQTFRFTEKWRQKWDAYYFEKINRFYRQEYDRLKPDVIFIYNNEMLLPATLEYFRKKSKIGFFLGDCPYYTPTSRHFLPILYYADAIYTYDSFWIEQLVKVGIKNIHFLYPNMPTHQHFEKQLSADLYERLKTEVLFVGYNYKNEWGFKKAKFLSCFADFDLQIHGNDSWERWYEYFPEVKRCHRLQQGFISVEDLNDMYNATKIAPVDANPGLLNGVHWRMSEVLGSGALPVMEWQKGIEELFGKDSGVPAIKSFPEAKEVTDYYLKHESERKKMVNWMRNVIVTNHSLEKNSAFIAQTMGLK